MQHLSIRSSAAARLAAAPAVHAAPRRMVRAPAAATDEMPNVTEAREWINKWRARQEGGSEDNGAAAAEEPEAAAQPETAAQPEAAAPAPVEDPAAKLQPCKSFSDGTLLFTSDRLKSVSFDDVKL